MALSVSPSNYKITNGKIKQNIKKSQSNIFWKTSCTNYDLSNPTGMEYWVMVQLHKGKVEKEMESTEIRLQKGLFNFLGTSPLTLKIKL